MYIYGFMGGGRWTVYNVEYLIFKEDTRTYLEYEAMNAKIG